MRKISGLIAVLTIAVTALSCGGGGDSTGTGGGVEAVEVVGAVIVRPTPSV